ncbi:MAG: hypothetical protein FH753_01555 [Firmicutes bacterium]|nr:hypothetical protein [Bacillota bacterium]
MGKVIKLKTVKKKARRKKIKQIFNKMKGSYMFFILILGVLIFSLISTSLEVPKENKLNVNEIRSSRVGFGIY